MGKRKEDGFPLQVMPCNIISRPASRLRSSASRHVQTRRLGLVSAMVNRRWTYYERDCLFRNSGRFRIRGVSGSAFKSLKPSAANSPE